MTDITPTPVSLPNATVRFLNSDGTVALPWRRFFQQVFTRSGGSTDSIATELAALQTAVTEAEDQAATALADAAAALTEAESAALFGALGNADNDIKSSNDTYITFDDAPAAQDIGAELLGLLGMSFNDTQSSGGGASALIIQEAGATLGTAGTINFTGSGQATTLAGGVATVDITGSTPSGALAAASASISGGAVTIDRETNVASISYTGVGRYRVTFTTALANAQYGVAFGGRFPTEAGPVLPIIGIDSISGYGATTTTLDIAVETAAGVIADLSYLTVLIYDPADFTGGGGGGSSAVGPHLYWALSPTAAQLGSNFNGTGQSGGSQASVAAEISMAATSGGSNQCTGGTAFASSQYSSTYSAAMAFDGNPSTFWSSQSGDIGFIGYEFASAVSVLEVKITTRNDTATYADQAYQHFAVLYSDDGKNWGKAWEGHDLTSYSIGSTKTFTAPAVSGGGGGSSNGAPNLYNAPQASAFPTLVGSTPPTLSQGAVTGGLLLNGGPGSSGDNWQMAFQAAPAGDWTVTARIKSLLLQTSGVPGVGICLSDSSGRIVTLAWTTRGDYGNLQVDRWNSPTSYNSEPLNIPMDHLEYFRIKDNGTNLIFYISPDGDAWTEVCTIPDNDWLTSRPTLIGFGVSVNTAGTPPTGWEYIINCLYFEVTTP